MKAELFILCHQDAQDNAINRIKEIALDGKIQVKLENKNSVRSVIQNNLYWLWMHKVSIDYHLQGYKLISDRVWHEYFKEHFLPQKIEEVRGVFIKTRKSTTKLTTKEFGKYLENIDHYVGSEMHIVLPHPEDLYNKAIYNIN